MKQYFVAALVILLPCFPVLAEATGTEDTGQLLDFPHGSYLKQIGKKHCLETSDPDNTDCILSHVTLHKRDNEIDSSSELVYQNHVLSNPFQLSKDGFDIIEVDGKLGLKPGKRKKPVPPDRSKSPNLPGKESPQGLIRLEQMTLPDTCNVEETYLTEEAQLIEAVCNNREKHAIKTIIPAYHALHSLHQLLNMNGHLTGQYAPDTYWDRFWAFLKYYPASIEHYQRECDQAGGTISFIRSDIFTGRSLASGFYFCSSKEKLEYTLPHDHQLVGYDPVHKLLVTRNIIPSATPNHKYFTVHLHALYDPDRCIERGFRLSGHGNSLHCEQ